MFLFGKKARAQVCSPVRGRIKPLGQVKDAVFAAGTMGPGFAVEPEDGKVCAPVNGTVTTLFPGGHALGITAEDGAEVLVHIGIDTVKLKGDGFTVHTSENARVRAGDLLVDADVRRLRERGYIYDVICVVTSKEKCRVNEELYGSYAKDTSTPVMSYKK